MTAGTECVSVAAEKPTTNWPTWHCQEACSRTLLETLDRWRLRLVSRRRQRSILWCHNFGHGHSRRWVDLFVGWSPEIMTTRCLPVTGGGSIGKCDSHSYLLTGLVRLLSARLGARVWNASSTRRLLICRWKNCKTTGLVMHRTSLALALTMALFCTVIWTRSKQEAQLPQR